VRAGLGRGPAAARGPYDEHDPGPQARTPPRWPRLCSWCRRPRSGGCRPRTF